MKNPVLTRLLAASCLAAATGLAVAQGTTPGTTPTNPAPESMGTPKSGPTPGSGAMGSADAMPSMADCKQMMADHKKNPSMAMDDDTKSKMKMCHQMHQKMKSDTTTSDSSKMN